MNFNDEILINEQIGEYIKHIEKMGYGKRKTKHIIQGALDACYLIKDVLRTRDLVRFNNEDYIKTLVESGLLYEKI